jgi:ureidoglycolate hydrolase
MRLEGRPPHFDRITRHRAVTQCLASAGGEPWWLAVATPAGVDDDGAVPDPAQLRAFTIPGDVAVRLHRGTWHAGPFFALPSQAFFNLELVDTNEVDHHTVGLGTTYRIVG